MSNDDNVMRIKGDPPDNADLFSLPNTTIGELIANWPDVQLSGETIAIDAYGQRYEFTRAEVTLLLKFLRNNINYGWLRTHVNDEAE